LRDPSRLGDLYWSSEEIDPHLRDIIPRRSYRLLRRAAGHGLFEGAFVFAHAAQARYRPGRAGSHDLLNIPS
jgi:hypothetical protein